MKTASRTKFFIEFYSTCLEGQRRDQGWVWSEKDGWGVGGLGAQSSQPPGQGEGKLGGGTQSGIPHPHPRVQEEL